MNKITYPEFKKRMCDFNRKNNIILKRNSCCFIKGVVVVSQDSFDREWSLEQRSYLVTSDSNGFIDGLISKSIYSSALSGDDSGVRLDWYLSEEGNKNGWKVDYCYFLDENV